MTRYRLVPCHLAAILLLAVLLSCCRPTPPGPSLPSNSLPGSEARPAVTAATHPVTPPPQPATPAAITRTAIPLTPTATLAPTTTPHPMQPATIDGLGAHDFHGGPIEVLHTLESTADYTRSAIAYPSDGLRITGVMQIPHGDGPFPVVVLNHGYYDRAGYQTGAGTSLLAEFLNRRGYLTIAPDYRSWGESDWGPSLFHSGLVADIANLVSSLPSIPQADISRVGLWGHSMGGGIATKLLTIEPRIRAAVLHAPNSPDDADLIARWGKGCLPGETETTTQCNPAEVILPDLSPEIITGYVEAAADPAILRRIAPLNYLERVVVPVQIHIGTADGADNAATPPEWSLKLADGLRAAGKPVELFVYEGQGHFFVGQAWDDMVARTADFFDTHLR